MVQNRRLHVTAMTCMVMASAACSQLGSILGGVGGAGSPQGGQLSGYIEGVDTRTQQIAIQTSGGQRVMLLFPPSST